VLRVQQGWSDDPDKDATLAAQATRKALETDPECSMALAIDGFVHTNLLKRLDIAEERYDLAIATNPSDALAHLLRGTMFAFRGEGPSAVSDTARALQLSPLDPHRWFFESLAATAHLAARDYDTALALADRSLRANRTHTSTPRAKMIAAGHLGQEDRARRTLHELIRLEPTFTVSAWLRRSPSADFPIGREWASSFRALGASG
jgi:tetratricopeptide (TPR) repeat protein